MNSQAPGQPGIEENNSALMHTWCALYACTARIRELQHQRGLPGGLLYRNVQLRVESQSAVQLAGACSALGAFGQAGPADLAALVNQLSQARKPPVTHAVDRVLGYFEQEVIARNNAGSLVDWPARHLAMLTCGLSRARGAGVQEALKHLAQALLRIPQLTEEAGWTARHLAMMSNGLGKGRGDCVDVALTRLAQVLPPASSMTADAGWVPQHLAMMANGLAKGRGICIRIALMHLGQALPAVEQMTADAGWTAQHLAMITNALGKGTGTQAALEHLAQALLCVPHLTEDAGWTVQPLAMMANGLAKGQGEAVQMALQRLGQALPCVQQITPEWGWSPLHLAMMANGLSRGVGNRGVVRRLAQALPDSGELTEEAGWTAQQLAMMANGLSKFTGPELREALIRIAQAITVRPLTLQRGWGAQDIALVANGLGKITGPDIQSALVHIARALCQRTLTGEHGWSVQPLVMVAHALARAEGPEIQQALSCLAEGVNRQASAAGQDWTAQHLAMMASALAQGTGAAVDAALTRLGQVLPDARQMTPEGGWSARHLAMLADGLAKGTGSRKALAHLARALPGVIELAAGAGWTPWTMAMMSRGLSRGEGPCIQAALERLAAASIRSLQQAAPQSGWSAGALALMVYGLSRGEGPCIKEALALLAAASVRSLEEPARVSGWTAPLLTLLANGLARVEGSVEGSVEGGEVQEALSCLAQTVAQSDLTPEQDWTAEHLVMMLEAMAPTLAWHAAFEAVTWALTQRAQQAPEALVRALACLSRQALRGPHLLSGQRLLTALWAQGFAPHSRQDRDELFWCTTLLHFASQQETPVDQELAGFFAQSCLHEVSCPDSRRCDQTAAALDAELWPVRWARDYWLPPVAVARDLPPVEAGRARVSAAQQQAFDQLRAGMPGHVLDMAVPVNHFCVDIMIDDRICVLVEESSAAARIPAEGEEAGHSIRQRRTRDLFIDHMLRQYGYRVFRIEEAQDPARRSAQVRQLMTVLSLPPRHLPAAGPEQTPLPQDRSVNMDSSPPAAVTVPDEEAPLFDQC